MCGADGDGGHVAGGLSGSSPRVRSGPFRVIVERHPPGIISACAERTVGERLVGAHAGDHLRVCGADVCLAGAILLFLGSSPRVRSGPTTALLYVLVLRDHLRVCGADRRTAATDGATLGSSPRVRSGRACMGLYRRLERIISACAERTKVG